MSEATERVVHPAKNINGSVRLPGDLVGIDGKIADVFNDIAAVSERRATETARVT